MGKNESSGVICYRRRSGVLEYLLAYPGGPYYYRCDNEGVCSGKLNDYQKWSIPKGKTEEGESIKAAALREFEEEVGISVAEENMIYLGDVRYKGGKRIHAFACEKDIDLSKTSSNHMSMEWPRKSGKIKWFPEIGDYKYMTYDEAKEKCHAIQFGHIEKLENILK